MELCPLELRDAGETGENLESCAPIPEATEIDEAYVTKFITRCLCASYRPPHLFSSCVANSAVALKILRKVTFLCSQQDNVVDVSVPASGACHIIGDIHGDIHSLISVLQGTGLPSDDNRLVFMGDYVDRGPWSVEIVLIVSLLKIWQPRNVELLRGNHETSGCTSRYGFDEEVRYKYSPKLVAPFMSLFRKLPVVAVVRNVAPEQHSVDDSKKKKKEKKKTRSQATRKQTSSSSSSSSSAFPWAFPLAPGERRLLVLHGGLFRSEEGRKEGRNDIARLSEVTEVSRSDADPYGTIIEDILWSDPQNANNGITENNLRGCGILFGQTTADYFFQNNQMCGMLRAHEGPDMREKRPEMNNMQNGYSVDMEMLSGFVATVFSSANYPFQDPKGNRGAFATVFGKKHEDNHSTSSIPRFTSFDRYKPPPVDEVHLFYTGESSAVTPRTSIS